MMRLDVGECVYLRNSMLLTVRRVSDIEHNGVARRNAMLITRLTLVPAWHVPTDVL